MSKIIGYLTGKKTYSVVAAAVLLIAQKVVGGDLSPADGVEQALPYLGLGAFRAAVAQVISLLKLLGR